MAELPIHIDPETGERWKLGNLEPPQGRMRFTWPIFGETLDTEELLVPRDKWDALLPADLGSFDPFLPYVHYQNGVGQCNADATAALAESMRLVQGLPFVALSASDLYARINGGSDDGSKLEDAVKEMEDRGIGLASTAGLIWHRGQTLSSDEERSAYKALKVTLCPTFDHVFSAVLHGKRIVSGVFWYAGFYTDSEGWLNVRRTGRKGGHAVMGYKATKRDGVYGIWHQNSWKDTWGLKGRAVFPEAMYHESGIGGWWAIGAITDEGGIVPQPK